MTANRERNYRKHPHTASFLQTFHTAMTEAERLAASERDEQDALAFIQEPKVTVPGTDGQVKAYAPQRNDGSYVCEIKGHTVRCGGPNVSEPQAKWIIDIATTRVLPSGATAESVLVRLEQGFAKYSGSQFITTYKGLPKAEVKPQLVKAAPSAPSAVVEDDGIYVDSETGRIFKV